MGGMSKGEKAMKSNMNRSVRGLCHEKKENMDLS